jgi:hypothetical protein
MNKVVRFLPELEFKYKFGSKGIYPIKGILKAVGISEGRKWFAILRCRKITNKNGGIQMEGFHYIEESFSFDNVVEGREVLEQYFEALEK